MEQPLGIIYCPSHTKFEIGTEMVTFVTANAMKITLASHRGGPGSSPGSMWGFRWTKWHWGRFSPSTLVSSANHSIDFSIIIITRGWHNRPTGGLSAEWTQLDSSNLKKI
jgi:hypothetical protein